MTEIILSQDHRIRQHPRETNEGFIMSRGSHSRRRGSRHQARLSEANLFYKEKMEKYHHPFTPVVDVAKLHENSHRVYVPANKDGARIMGLTTDWHTSSKRTHEDEIERYIDHALKEGVTHFFHGGDMHDGLNIYPGQIHDVVATTVEEQVDRAAKLLDKVLPKGTKMWGIAGNHDGGVGFSGLYPKFGIDMMKMLEQAIPEKFKYLHDNGEPKLGARVWVANNTSLDLIHTKAYPGPRGAPEYTLMKIVDGYHPDGRPDFMFVGHTHKACNTLYKGVNAFLGGGFEDANEWMRRNQVDGNRQGGYVMVFYTNNKGEMVDHHFHFIETRRGI